MKIIVTGGAGYIGAITVSELLKKGFEVGVIDTLENGYYKNIPKKVNFFKGNIQNVNFLEKVFSEFKPKVIIHLASYSLVEESFKNPLKYYKNNLGGSYSLFSTAIKKGVEFLVFSSSCSVYGIPNLVPIIEASPTNPINPYGETKLAIEKMLKWFGLKYRLKSICLRYFNVAGASLDGLLGENHSPETHLIPNIFKSALREEEVLIFGDNYKTEDSTCIRDYVHPVDLAEAHILSINDLVKSNKCFRVYNVGSGRGYSNGEIVQETEKLLNKKIQVKYCKKRKGDPPILIANTEKIRKELGFKPRYSDLQTIFKTHWKWCENNDKI